MKFPTGKRLRVGSWSSVTKFAQADSVAAGLSVGGVGGSTHDPDAEFWASCSYIRDFQSFNPTGSTNLPGWDGTLEGGAFVHPEAGEGPKSAMVFFSLDNAFFSAPHSTVELSVPISTCTCMHAGETTWYYKLPPPPHCRYHSHILNYCTESFTATVASPPPDPPPPPPPLPRPPGECSNTCAYAGNGVCEDSRASTSSRCAYGTDCDDCGMRAFAPPPTPPSPALPTEVAALPNNVYLPSSLGKFVEGLNTLEVRTQCGLRAEGGVVVGWDSLSPAVEVPITTTEYSVQQA